MFILFILFILSPFFFVSFVDHLNSITCPSNAR
jgi:hypothetical protein